MSAFLVASLGYLYAILIPGGVPATVVIPGLLQLTPGFLGTKAVLAQLGGTAGSDETFFRVLLVATQLVSGLLLSSVLFARVLRI